MAESSIQQVAKKNCRPGIIACRSILPTQIFRKESTSFASAGKGWKIPGDSFFSNQTEKKPAPKPAFFSEFDWNPRARFSTPGIRFPDPFHEGMRHLPWRGSPLLRLCERSNLPVSDLRTLFRPRPLLSGENGNRRRKRCQPVRLSPMDPEHDRFRIGMRIGARQQSGCRRRSRWLLRIIGWKLQMLPIRAASLVRAEPDTMNFHRR